MSVVEKLNAAGLRAFADKRNEKINYKVREHSEAKIPAILAVGRQEVEQGTVAVRRLGGQGQKVVPLAEAIAALKEEAVTPDLRMIVAEGASFTTSRGPRIHLSHGEKDEISAESAGGAQVMRNGPVKPSSRHCIETPYARRLPACYAPPVEPFRSRPCRAEHRSSGSRQWFWTRRRARCGRRLGEPR